MQPQQDKRVVIIGAGPAGLTAAYELGKAGVKCIVLEKGDTVGGLAKTVDYKGYRFDIGGHRFFTKVKAVEDIWREVLPPEDFLRRPRLSRIYYNKKFFRYPLHAFAALSNLGLWNSLLILLSYIRAQVLPVRPEETFEQWVSNRFGKHLFRIFFKTYTEKVWGIPCSEITAEWAAQRIKGLSLLSALKHAVIKTPPVGKNGTVKTLIEEFDYPRCGPGMMWEEMTKLVRQQGADVRLSAGVERIAWKGDRVTGVAITSGGRQELVQGSHFISSMPIRELVQKLDPAAPAAVQHAANNLNYRDFITVALVINKPEVFPDNWLYIHEPGVRLGRIQNFKNWSPDMVPDATKTCLGLEYFCFEGDGLWTMSDQELIELGTRELSDLGLAAAAEVTDGTVVRVPKAYPVYDSGYQQALSVVRSFIDRFSNLQLVGRNGMHKYNNQDHSMLTAMLAVKNILGGNYDLWTVNADEEYHEGVMAGGQQRAHEYALLAATQPQVPTRKVVKVFKG